MTIRNGNRAALSFLALVLLASAGVNQARAQQGFDVEYRLVNWKSMHFHDAAKADLHFKTVKDLGCEAKQMDHDGHTDVMFRCTNWRRITLRSDQGAHQWQNWLKACGFETKHQH